MSAGSTGTLSTHVLDSTTGTPAVGMMVTLSAATASGWSPMGSGVTDADGRLRDLVTEPLEPGGYQLVFATGAWFAERGRECFYPEVSIAFMIAGAGHHHVPLLLAPYAYSTYRGS